MPGVDFAAIRAAVSMEKVLELLKFAATERRGLQVRGPCPIHGSQSPASRSFSANLAKNAFLCFRCGAQGNQLDLWAQVHKLPLIEAVEDLCRRAHIPIPRPGSGPKSNKHRTEKRNP